MRKRRRRNRRNDNKRNGNKKAIQKRMEEIENKVEAKYGVAMISKFLLIKEKTQKHQDIDEIVNKIIKYAKVNGYNDLIALLNEYVKLVTQIS